MQILEIWSLRCRRKIYKEDERSVCRENFGATNVDARQSATSQIREQDQDRYSRMTLQHRTSSEPACRRILQPYRL